MLIDVPERIETARLVLRPPGRGDGAALNAAVLASRERLALWLPWARETPSLSDSEAYCRRQHAKFVLREDLTLLMLARDPAGGEGGESGEGEIVGATGLHRLDWRLRTFEVGYWLREGHEGRGLMTEAVVALAGAAFERLAARRVEIRCDPANTRSWRVAERAGFAFEGTLHRDSATPAGAPRDTRVYARVR